MPWGLVWKWHFPGEMCPGGLLGVTGAAGPFPPGPLPAGPAGNQTAVPRGQSSGGRSPRPLSPEVPAIRPRLGAAGSGSSGKQLIRQLELGPNGPDPRAAATPVALSLPPRRAQGRCVPKALWAWGRVETSSRPRRPQLRPGASTGRGGGGLPGAAPGNPVPVGAASSSWAAGCRRRCCSVFVL